MHLQDWQSAYDYVTGQLGDVVDTSKVLLWGTSFAGGHVLTTAAKLKHNITAVVAQVRRQGSAVQLCKLPFRPVW